MLVTDRQALHPVRVGLEIAAALHRAHGGAFKVDDALRLLGSPEVIARIKAGEDPARIGDSFADDEARFRLMRAKYLIYR